jgi:drug/metabolite transporter (DMT)-like permease
VFGVIGGAMLHGEVMTTKEYFGCAIVFLAVVISQLDFKTILKKLKKCK